MIMIVSARRRLRRRNIVHGDWLRRDINVLVYLYKNDSSAVCAGGYVKLYLIMRAFLHDAEVSEVMSTASYKYSRRVL